MHRFMGSSGRRRVAAAGGAESGARVGRRIAVGGGSPENPPLPSAARCGWGGTREAEAAMAARAGTAGVAPGPGAEGEAFRERHAALIAALAPGVRPAAVADACVVHLPATVPPWTATPLSLGAGDAVTLLAEGRIVLSEALGLWGGPRLHLWARIGGRGPLHNGTRDTTTLRAAHAGPLELAVYQGEWADRDGAALATPREAYAALRGGIDVVAIRWQGDPAEGLAALRARAPEDALLAAEAARLAAPVPAPPGWEYLWFLGPAEIFRAARADGADAIHARAEDDVGILRRPVDFPLGPDVELAWRWRVDRLPSAVAEDTLPCHDYLSIALEFETGRDLTWTWSAALPAGTAYACPIPSWQPRETHLVVRSGPAGLGAWQEERRRVVADWRHAVGGPPPNRIVAVWLIAVSVFRHGVGEAVFAGIELGDGARRLSVL
jgi:hypothetical protein